MRNIFKILTITTLALTLALPFTAYASEQTQTNRWEGLGDVWRVKDNAGGYLKNSWFQDNDSSWYMLGADGAMYAGLITDQSTGKSYLLNTNHDGTYGRMFTVDGSYNINGMDVYLTFNQSHDGSYGAITSGIEALRNTGVYTEEVSGITTDSTTTSNNSNSNTGKTKESNTYPDGNVFNWDDYAGQDGGGATGWHAGEFNAY